MRTFIAVNLTDEIRGDFIRHLDTFRPLARHVSWVKPGNAHITLKFLGEVDEKLLPEVVAGVRQAVAGHEPFEVQLGGFGAFPNFNRPRVLWVGIIAGVDLLAALAKAIDREMMQLGFPKEKRRFSPHITLGRIRKPGRYDDLRDAAEKTIYESAPFTVNSIEVMKSVLSPHGATYSVFESIDVSP